MTPFMLRTIALLACPSVHVGPPLNKLKSMRGVICTVLLFYQLGLVKFRFYSTNIVEDSNVKRYALNSWQGATPEVRKAYGSPDSFDEYYGKMPKKIPNLR